MAINATDSVAIDSAANSAAPQSYYYWSIDGGRRSGAHCCSPQATASVAAEG